MTEALTHVLLRLALIMRYLRRGASAYVRFSAAFPPAGAEAVRASGFERGSAACPAQRLCRQAGPQPSCLLLLASYQIYNDDAPAAEGARRLFHGADAAGRLAKSPPVADSAPAKPAREKTSNLTSCSSNLTLGPGPCEGSARHSLCEFAFPFWGNRSGMRIRKMFHVEQL